MKNLKITRLFKVLIPMLFFSIYCNAQEIDCTHDFTKVICGEQDLTLNFSCTLPTSTITALVAAGFTHGIINSKSVVSKHISNTNSNSYFDMSGTGQLTIYTYYKPNPVISTSPITICEGSAFTISSGESNSTYLTFAWDSPLSVITTEYQKNISIASTLNTGLYNLTVTNNLTTGCTGTASKYLTIIPMPTISGTGPNVRCGGGSVNLNISSSAASINWYNDLVSSSSGTGLSYNTPSISYTRNFYVVLSGNGCTTARLPVLATVINIPTINGTTPGSRCDEGSVILGASTGEGTINWYASSSSGDNLIIGNGITFSTPSISSNTTYYAEAIDSGCKSARTSVLATIYSTPVVSAPGASNCGPGTVDFTAITTPLTAGVKWYTSSVGGTSISNSKSFSPIVSETTTYYVEATENGCMSVRQPVVATINDVPAITSEFVASTGCSGSVVTGIIVTPVDAGSYTYSWTAPGYGPVTTQNVSCLADNKTYTVRVTNASGCPADFPILVKPMFNIALVLDRSGSMSITPAGYTFTKWQLLKSDIDLLLGLISDGNITTMPADSISSICYNHLVSVYTEGGNSYFPAFKSLDTKTKFDAFMASVSPTGSTSIGGAVQTAIQPVLGRSTPVRVLLVTDGLQNTNPMIDASTYVIDNKAGIYSVAGGTSPMVPPMDLDNFGVGKDIRVYGIGIGTDCDHTLLNSIATATGGEYYSAFDPLYMTKSITEFYTDLFSLYSPQLINFYIDTIKASTQQNTKEFKISGQTDKMIFFIAYNTDAAPSFELTKDNISIPISATLHTGSSYKMATLSFPMKIKGKTIQPCGSWYMKISGNKNTIYKAAAIINDHKVKLSYTASVKDYMIPIEVKIRGDKEYLHDVKVTAQIFKPTIDAGDLLSNFSANAGKNSRLTVLAKDRSCIQTFRKKNPDFAGVSDAQVKWTMQSVNKKIAGLFKLKPDAVVTFTQGKEGIFSAEYKATLCGTYRINYTIEAKTSCGTFYRTYTREIVVKPGNMNIEHSSIVFVKTNPDYDIIIIRPKDKVGHLLGPGIGNTLTIKIGDRLPDNVRDNLDGSYTLFYRKLSTGRFEGSIRIEQNKQLVDEKKISEIKETEEPAEIIKLVSVPEVVKKP